MEITFTSNALEQMNKLDLNEGKLKLRYETDGCGCVVSGVNELWLVNTAEDGDIEVKTNAGGVLVEESKQVFLDENLIIDFSPTSNMFMLKSKNEILTPRMRYCNKVN